MSGWLRFPSAPAPPEEGLIKLADPRRLRQRWRLFFIFLTLCVLISWPLGLRSILHQLRRELVAVSYMRLADRQAHSVPVRRAQALALLKRAVAIAPNRPEIRQAAIQLFIELRAYPEAASLLEQAQPPRFSSALESFSSNSPTDLFWQISRAQCLLMTDQRPEGEKLLREVKTKIYTARFRQLLPDPLYALLLNNVAYVKALAELDLEEALQMAQEAVRLQPLQPAYIDSLGWIEYLLGDYQEASFYLERAVRLALPEENAEMYYHLGTTYARLGAKAKARWALQRCLALDPSFEEAQEELRALGRELPLPYWALDSAQRIMN